jgi:outer membrane biosynthesis protein TonB
VLFLVHRDGSVSGLQFVRRSGNFAFDLEAQGAIEAAANANAFGPLPEGYPADVLPVSFFFDPETMR